jgi:hypothetical protein
MQPKEPTKWKKKISTLNYKAKKNIEISNYINIKTKASMIQSKRANPSRKPQTQWFRMNLYKEQSEAHIRNRLKGDQEQHNLGSGNGMEKMCLEPTSTSQPPVQESPIRNHAAAHRFPYT